MKENQLIQLVEEMTIDEKINQLLQLAAAFYSDKAEEKTGPMSELGLSQETIDTAGTTLGVSGANEAKRVQKEYMQNHRLNIPTLLMADIIHGFRTIFPIPLALEALGMKQRLKKWRRFQQKKLLFQDYM
ncbi:hypothetical protein EfsSVR2332_25820 [Enterococcus faecalis]|uniref:Uncharacterized protein n=1 Tax=Enterococcus faecalis TaxID=1351 RepID=A0AC59HS06_ENTFL|nr:hypothetical protein EfsSVR2332_25820 [Enterococcus faecalis]